MLRRQIVQWLSQTSERMRFGRCEHFGRIMWTGWSRL